MKLRFSNGKDFAITFGATNVNEFYQQAVSALRTFRTQTERRIHQGEIGKTRSWFENVELHVYSETFNIWQDLSDIRFLRNEYSEFLSYRQTFKIRFASQASNLPHVCDMDKKLIDKNAAMIWRGLVDSNQWADNMNLQISKIDDDLRRLTEEK